VVKPGKKFGIIDPGMRPYFFIPKKDYWDVKYLINKKFEVDTDPGAETVDGRPVVKIEVDFPDQVKYLRDKLEERGVETFESDIPFVKRWMIDNHITHGEIKTRAYVDIECDSRSGFPDPEKAPARIIAISVVLNDGTEYFISDMDEKKMLQEFWDIMREKAEMVTGWNLRRFDWPYLINRSKQVLGGVPFVGVQELDAMFNFQKIVRWNAPGLGMKLDDIAYEFLGFRKLDDFENKEGIHALYESFLGDKKLLYEYNMRDAKLVALLDEYLHLSDPYIEISKEFPIMLRETGYVSDIVEVLVLTTAQEVSPRIVFPRKKQQKAGIIGAITKEPEPGLHRNVMVLDFKSMYNTIIQAWCISPEIMKKFKDYYRHTFGRGVKWDDWNSGIHFMREYVKFVKEMGYEPIFSKFLSKVEAKREYAKKMRDKYQEGDPEFTRWQLAQFGFKLILVSTYGATGYSGARYFDEDTANAITFCGRWIITTGMQIAQELGFKVLYGDTDSFFLHKPGMSLEEAKNIIDFIAMRIQDEIRNRALKTFGEIAAEKLELEPKCIYSKLLLTEAKKVYWGKIVWEEGKEVEKKDVEKKDVKGAAMKRSDRFELLGMVQDWITDLFFNMDADERTLLKELEKLKQNIKNRLFAGEFDKYLVLRKNVRGDIDSYKADQPHVRVAKKLREMGLYRPGDAVRWVVVADGVEEPVIGDEIPKPTVSGYAYYWKRIEDAIDRMICPLIKAKEVTLSDFFG
jgi:DNA polymerase elongation subunit (family B)